MMLESAVQEFLLACQADGLKPATVRWYKSMLRHVLDAFQDADLATVTPSMLRQYIAGLRQRDNRYAGSRAQRPAAPGGLSSESVAGHVRTLHRFFAWCSREYGIPNPMTNIRRPGRSFADPKGVSLDDVRRLFAATGDDLQGARDRALLAFLIDTGCRADGLLQLGTEKLELDQRRAFVSEKGRSQRAVFLTEFTAGLLHLWLEIRPPTATTVFCSLSPSFYARPLSYEGLRMILRRLKEAAQVSGRVNPHAFRHGYAREYIKNGGDLATLSRLMGHADSSVTSRYYAVFETRELASSHDKFSPTNRLIDPKNTTN